MAKLPPVDNGPNLIEEVYAGLQRRFGRIPRAPEPIVYEFTDDRALLHQYYRMRGTMYRKVHHIDKFSGAEDVYDKISHILIARRGKLCIGGCRLIVREGDEDFLLPMEEENFKIRNVFPDLPLTKFRHGEVSRFAVLDEDRDSIEVMRNLIILTAEKGIDLGLGYIFYKAPPLVTRSNRKVINNYCPALTPVVCTGIKVPENPDYPEIQWLVTKVILPAAKEVAPANAEEQYALPEDSSLIVH